MDGLVRALAEFGLARGDAGPDAEQILDLLWLARDPPPLPAGRAAPVTPSPLRVPAPPTVREEAIERRPPEPTGPDSPATVVEPVFAGDTPSVRIGDGAAGSPEAGGPPEGGGPAEGAGAGDEDAAPGRAGSDEGPDRLVPVTGVGFKGVRPLRDALELTRALRPFRRAVRPGPLVPDEEATVQATAEAWVTAALSARAAPSRAGAASPRPLVVVTHRPPVRALDVALVVDTGSSMRIWERAFTQLEHIFVQSGAFRAVTRWGLLPRRDGSRLVDAGGTRHPPDRLRDPSGRRLVLLASDAVGDHWYDRDIWETIESWAAVMPTALLHVLPRRYWGETAVGEPCLRMRLGAPGTPAPNAHYTVERGWWITGTAGLPLPVVGLSPAGLGGWAGALTSGATWAEGISTAVPGTGPAEHPSAYNRRLENRDGQLLAAFMRRASPRAVHLAQVLSCAPTLSTQLIEILQEHLAPETGLAERAEIFVSGLLEPAGSESYRFLPAAVETFREQVGHLEELKAFNVASDHLQRNFGVGGDLRTLVPDPGGKSGVPVEAEPFAQLRRNMADRLAVLTGPEDAVAAILPDGGRPSGEGFVLPAGRHPAGEPPRPVSLEPAPFDRAAVPAARTAPVPRALPALPAPVAALAGHVAAVEGGGALTILDIGAAGVTRYRVHRDAMGTPHPSRLATEPWTGLGTEGAAAPRIERLTGGRGPLAAIRTAPAGLAEADRVAALVREARPDADLVTAPDADVAGWLRRVVEREPIRQPYSLVALAPHNGAGGLRLTTVPLFAPGALRDDSVPVSVRCEPGADAGTAFAVGAHGPDGLFRVMSIRSARIRSGHHDLVARLRRPGLVRFGGLDGLAADRRDWTQIVTAVPDRYDPRPRPLHLVCLVEVSGARERVADRLSRIDQLVMLLGWEVPAGLSVSLVAYGRHDYGDRLGRRDPVPDVLAWSADARTARAALSAATERAPLPVTYPDAAMVEDALAVVDERLPRRPGGRTALLTVGDRPPHPARVTASEILPCPNRRDWTDLLRRLEAREGMTFAAICDDPARRPEAPWRRLGGGAPPVPLDVVDAQRLAIDLRLVPPMAARLPLPLVI
ncbi:SAV_2336 N-terminal domain-related protein [Actinomadura sp. NPDC048955]|uniref:SAV_2336 N-terminal domain-related protein n=1 Tax=Actinomadura sp. NPDC048955 TaxID=3158228 RepID=UPI0033CD4E8F